MRRLLQMMWLGLVLAALTGCARSGPDADQCPPWLTQVAPVWLPPEPVPPRLERDILILNEAGQRIGCW